MFHKTDSEELNKSRSIRNTQEVLNTFPDSFDVLLIAQKTEPIGSPLAGYAATRGLPRVHQYQSVGHDLLAAPEQKARPAF